MPLLIVRDNIVHMHTDAIVNAANTGLKAGGGVCGSIFDAAGFEELAKDCARIGFCEVGKAVLTPGHRLPAKYVIHAVGPVWQGGNHGEEELLRSCYASALELAKARGLASIAFPLISSGIYGYPKDQALQIAVSQIGSFLLQNDMTVYLVVYDRTSFQLSEKLFSAIQSYIDDNYVHERRNLRHLQAPAAREAPPPPAALQAGEEISPALEAPRPLFSEIPFSLQNALKRTTDTFSQAVLHIIDRKGFRDVDVYKRANLDRKLFSKLRGNKGYTPSKQTAVALAIALELELNETGDLLARAGYALSPCNRSDLIVSYYIRKGNYNIFEINQALFAFDEAALGA